MSLMEKPAVSLLSDGGKYWEHEYEKFFAKVYVPTNTLEGQVNNYSFRAPLLLVFEEKKMNMDEAIEFAEHTGLANIAASVDSSVIFIYPTCEGGWKNATMDLYVDVIAEVKMDPNYEDGMTKITNFFTREFQGYFIRGAKFRTDIYSFGDSADYVASNLLKQIEGEFLWGPGDITPAMCSMERLSVLPKLERTDIGILSVGNSDEINESFSKCENLLIKKAPDYEEDFKKFVRKFKMWCGQLELEPDFDELKMTEEAGYTLVNTSSDNRGRFKDCPNHKVGYFAYYNHGLFEKGPVPLLIGFHGGGDCSMYLTFVSGWYEIANRYGFLYVAIENHQDVTATEMVEVIEDLKKKYAIDEHRIYASGFSMGSGKTWDMFQQYPQIFAGMAPASALFPVKNNPFNPINPERFNTKVSVPLFYSGGEKSHLPELPCQDATALERIQYASQVNQLKAKFDLEFEKKEQWENPIYGISGERMEVLADESRGSKLTIQYYESEDGVCRTAFASIDNQVHECRLHTNETAWKFISQFTR